MSHNSATVGQRVQPSCSLSGHSVSWCADLIPFAAAPTLNCAVHRPCTLKKGLVLDLTSSACEILSRGVERVKLVAIGGSPWLAACDVGQLVLGFCLVTPAWMLRLSSFAARCRIEDTRVRDFQDRCTAHRCCALSFNKTNKKHSTHLLRHQGYCLLLEPGMWRGVSACSAFVATKGI